MNNDAYEALERAVRKEKIVSHPALDVFVLFGAWSIALLIAFTGELLAIWLGSWVTTFPSRIALTTPVLALWFFLQVITVQAMRTAVHDRKRHSK